MNDHLKLYRIRHERILFSTLHPYQEFAEFVLSKLPTHDGAKTSLWIRGLSLRYQAEPAEIQLPLLSLHSILATRVADKPTVALPL